MPRKRRRQKARAKGSFDLADGIYKGTGTGYAGEVTVAVTIKDKQITAIDILSSSDDAAFFNRAKAVIDRIIAGQTLDVDVVSGATFSSRYYQCGEECLTRRKRQWRDGRIPVRKCSGTGKYTVTG